MPAISEDSVILCRGCDYDLRALPAGRCPECGRGFDPGDARTFNLRKRAVYLRWLLPIEAATALVVLLPVAMGRLTLFIAGLQLGRWPVAWQDDPKSLNIEPFYSLSMLSLLAGFYVVLLAPLLALACLILRTKYARHRWYTTLMSLLLLGAVGLSVREFWWDPWDVWRWLLD